MSDDSVVPEYDRSLLPVGSKLEVRVDDESLVEQGEDSVALGFGDSHDPSSEAGVDEDALESGDGVNSNDGMDRLDRLTSNVISDRLGSVGLSDSRVDGGESGKVGLEGRREGGVKSVSGGEAVGERRGDA